MPRPRWSPWGQEGGRRGEGRQGWGGGDGRGGGGRLSPSGASQRVWMGPSENHKPQNCHLPSASHQIGDLEPGGGGRGCRPQTQGKAAAAPCPSSPRWVFLRDLLRRPGVRASRVPLGLSASPASGSQASGQHGARLGGNGCRCLGSGQTTNPQVHPILLRSGLFQEVPY